VTLARKLHRLGFRLERAETFIVMLAEEPIRIVTANVEFERVYIARVFEGLPLGFKHQTFKPTDRPAFSRISLWGGYFPALIMDDAVKTALLAAIESLYSWADELDKSHKIEVFRLAGFL
jgi:hypothetical protein